MKIHYRSLVRTGMVWLFLLGGSVYAQEVEVPEQQETDQSAPTESLPEASSTGEDNSTESESTPHTQTDEPVKKLPQPKDNKALNTQPDIKGAALIPSGRELVNMDFPEPTEIKDIIKAIALWQGKNVILSKEVSGKIQIISPKKVTKEEAYQAFLSALNVLGYTTVETGKLIKIMGVAKAVKQNLETYQGSHWAPRTDKVITQIIPLKYIEAKTASATLKNFVNASAMYAHEPTNTLIVSDSGYRIRRILEILQLLDVQTQQPKVLVVPLRHTDPKTLADKVNDILQGGKKGAAKQGYNSFRLITDERTNSIIIFGPPHTIKDVRDFIKKFDRPIDDPTTQASIHVRPLDYADATKIASTLSTLASGGKSSMPSAGKKPPTKAGFGTKGSSGNNGVVTTADLGDGVKITADESSNSLLITGSRAAYDALNTIIRKLDVRRPQVYVEADILDISESNDFQLGTSIFAGSGKKDGSGTKIITAWEAGRMAPLIVAGSDAGKSLSASTTAAANVAGAFNDAMKIGILAGSSISVPGLGSFTPGALINLLKADSNSRILSSPSILTSNNETAVISVGQKLFFRSSVSNAQTGTAVPKMESVDADTSLNIKPNISHSDYVTVNIELESNNVKDLTSEGVPRIGKKKSKQLVTVKNGQTIVISGLVDNHELESYSEIPLLGQLPIIGPAFRNTKKQKTKSDLVIFLTPHIIHGAGDLASIYKKKINENKSYFEQKYGPSYAKNEFYKRLPTEDAGEYKPTEFDQLEEKRLEQHREDVLKAIGQEGHDNKTEEKAAVMEEIEMTLPVPFEPDMNGSGSSSGSIPPPPAAEHVDLPETVESSVDSLPSSTSNHANEDDGG